MADEQGNQSALAAEDHARWWSTVGKDELGQLLYWRWDPVQVSDDFPATKGEYDDYVDPLMRALREGAQVQQVFDHLRRVEIEYMGGELSGGNALRALAYSIVDWYAESIAQWAAGEPLR